MKGVDNQGGPAFPKMGQVGIPEQDGMTRRQWLAGLAMQGMWSNAALYNHPGFDRSGCAQEAYSIADAMLKFEAEESKGAGEGR